MRTSAIILTTLIGFTATAAVVDRVAVVVGKIVITESEVLQEVRLTGFLNGQPLDLGAQPRREAAERLVDQQLIRGEIQIGRYPEPTAAESDAIFKKFRQEQHPNDAEFQAALQKYGITEDQLKQHLVWQLETIHFTDVRFRPGTPSTPAAPQSAPRSGAATVKTPNANRASPADANEPADQPIKTSPSANAQAASDAPEESVDQQMDSWLKEARAQVRIQFKKEAFQ
jgi:hypothetical protein